MTPLLLSQMRRDMRLTISQLADILGRTRSCIYHYERGIRKIPKALIVAMHYMHHYYLQHQEFIPGIGDYEYVDAKPVEHDKIVDKWKHEFPILQLIKGN